MNWVTILAIYFILWWLILFTVLPLNIRSQVEEGDVVEGTEPGAPANPQMKKKLILTSVITAVLLVIILAVLKSGLVNINDLPFFDGYLPGSS